MEELAAITELFVMLFTDARTGTLVALLLMAAVIDYRTYRIPNWLTAAGVVLGLAYSIGIPLTAPHGFAWSCSGLLVGFLLMLPLYLLRTMGAGDVKLVAMAGVYLGVADILFAALFAVIVGGIGALLFGLLHRATGKLFSNVKQAATALAWSALLWTRPSPGIHGATSVGRLPFGICIAIGTIGWVMAKQFGFA